MREHGRYEALALRGTKGSRRLVAEIIPFSLATESICRANGRTARFTRVRETDALLPPRFEATFGCGRADILTRRLVAAAGNGNVDAGNGDGVAGVVS